MALSVASILSITTTAIPQQQQQQLADALILINLTLRLNWSINVPLRVGLLIVQQCL